MDLDQLLKKGISKAFRDIFDYEIQPDKLTLQPTRKDFNGTHTLVAFPFSRPLKKAPPEIAEAIGKYLQANIDEVKGYGVVKGFLNIEFTDATWLTVFKDLYRKKDFGFCDDNGIKIMVEYSSPNTNKPIHLGHMRNNFLGFAVSNILKSQGYDVRMVNLVNDRGIHICKSMLAYQKFGNGETPESSKIKGDHLIGKYYVLFEQKYRKEVDQLIADGMKGEDAMRKAPLLLEAQDMLKRWEEKDPQVVALWEKMNSWVYEGFEQTYERMGVKFDQYYYESSTYLLGKDIIREGLEKGVFFEKDDGSVWVDLSDEGLDEKLVLRADGTSVYITQDLGAADKKYDDFAFERSIYVVGNEQDYHFEVLFRILKKLGRPYADGMYHLSYGMVDLPSGRMKSREGTVIDADDLIREMVDIAEKHTRELGKIEGMSEEESVKLFEKLGLGALKYFLLKVDPKKRMLFDPEESIQFHGNTGPFIQYTYARISAILRKARETGIDPEKINIGSLKSVTENEREVIYLLNEFPVKLREAAEEYSPAVLAQYVYELAREYNRFYTDVPIFKAESDRELEFRIAFSQAVAFTLSKAMNLLGIAMPEQM